MDDPQQQTILKLAAAGISVYSPHTALDAARPGLADWLVNVVKKEGRVETIQQKEGHGMMRWSVWGFNWLKYSKKALGIGYGRIKHFDKPIGIETVIENIKTELRLDKSKCTGYCVALLMSNLVRMGQLGNTKRIIQSIACCPGSGMLLERYVVKF